MTEEEMLQELKDWDLSSWEKFKQDNYETIILEFPKDD